MLCSNKKQLEQSNMLRHVSPLVKTPHEVETYLLSKQCYFNVINHPNVIAKVITVLKFVLV